ncbi:putative RND superfamily exporter [Lachnospiraceae bacterium JC7]|nr:putative RND superfamily exporter [Lachnospiraceae bacterium JC7]
MENQKSPLVAICSFIVDKRNLFFLIYFILIIFSVFSQNWVSVENDLSAYLSEDTETKQAMNLMESEYTTFGSAKVMVSNISLREAFSVCDTIKGTPGVFETGFLPEYLNPASGEIAKEDEELTIDEIREHYNDSSALFDVVFKYPEDDERCLDSLNALKEALGSYDLHVSTTLGDVQAEAIEEEMQVIIVIVAAVVVLVLILTSETFGEVPVLLLTFSSAALINKGTNYMMGTISFVSNSVAIVLQLALSIDYAIIFCNHFKEQREFYDTRDAVIIALSHSIPEITSSSLTTISGLLALLFMGFGLGRDLGLTLTKSIIISLFAVFTLMPGLLVLFSNIMMKTKHKNLVPKIPFVGRFAYATKKFIPPVFLVVIVAGYFISSKCPYVYGYSNLKTPIRSAAQITEDMIRDTFGSNNLIAINMPSHDYYKISRLAASLESMPEVKSVTSLANTEAKGGYMVSQPLTPRQFSEMADLDYDVAAMVYSMYASDKDEYGHIIGGIDKYKIPFIDVFMFLHDKIDEGYVELNDEDRADIDDTFDILVMAKKQLRGERYERMLVYLNLPEESDETFSFLKGLHRKIDPIFEEEMDKDPAHKVLIVGESTSEMDLGSQFVTDNIIVSVVSLLFVLVILLFTFKSVGMPLLLIMVIEGSIFINFSFPTIMKENIFFISYLIVSSIQMGANIDYAIVIGSRYDENRKTMGRKEAIIETVNFAFPTIITSGSILAIAGTVIGFLTSDGAIAGIGQSIGRGTLLSMFLVLFVLPQILLLGDKIIAITKFSVARPIKARAESGIIRVDGRITGHIDGQIIGTVHGIVRGDVRASIISGDIQKLAENEGQNIEEYMDHEENE